MSVDWTPRILGFCCTWCAYAGADLAGSGRLQVPVELRIIRVPCTGRVRPEFVLKAFQWGADAVLVAGCHPGDCHYRTGNYHARRRLLGMRPLLEAVGIDPRRFHLCWISSSESKRFVDLSWQIREETLRLGPYGGEV